MEVLAYEGPDGELTLNPSLERICAFLGEGADYWEGGSGSAYIGWIKQNGTGYSNVWERPALHLIVHKPHGIHLRYQIMNYRPHTSSIKLIIDGEIRVDAPIEHYLGGEPECLPQSSFVSQEVAVRVITDFLQTGQPSASVAWKPQRA